MRRTISEQTWEQMKTAYASGSGLRELARNMGIPEGTVLARANREGWTQQIATAKLIERPDLVRDLLRPDAINAITPLQSVATTMVQRGQRYAERMAGVSESVVPHLEGMQPAEILEGIHEIEKFDKMTRRTFGLSDSTGDGGSLALNILTQGGVIQINQTLPNTTG